MDLSREQLILGDKIESLKNKKVLLLGVGGVGGFCLEALVRSGIEDITIIDGDKIDSSNLNRQIISLSDNIGKNKVEVAKERIKTINPNCKVTAVNAFYLPENSDFIDFSEFDYVIDAIDTVTSKIDVICKCNKLNVKVISSMGTGGKIDIAKLKVCDLFETTDCPLARVMRHELKKRGIERLKVVFSNETSVKRDGDKNQGQPSMIFVPAVAGLMLAKEVIFDLIGD